MAHTRVVSQKKKVSQENPANGLIKPLLDSLRSIEEVRKSQDGIRFVNQLLTFANSLKFLKTEVHQLQDKTGAYFKASENLTDSVIRLKELMANLHVCIESFAKALGDKKKAASNFSIYAKDLLMAYHKMIQAEKSLIDVRKEQIKANLYSFPHADELETDFVSIEASYQSHLSYISSVINPARDHVNPNVKGYFENLFKTCIDQYNKYYDLFNLNKSILEKVKMTINSSIDYLGTFNEELLECQEAINDGNKNVETLKNTMRANGMRIEEPAARPVLSSPSPIQDRTKMFSATVAQSDSQNKPVRKTPPPIPPKPSSLQPKPDTIQANLTATPSVVDVGVYAGSNKAAKVKKIKEVKLSKEEKKPKKEAAKHNF